MVVCVMTSPPAQPAVSVDHVVKVYKTARAVDGISFALARGSVTALLGAPPPDFAVVAGR